METQPRRGRILPVCAADPSLVLPPCPCCALCFASPNSAPFSPCSVANLTAHTPYEISAWAKTELGDSPLSFVHVVTSGTRPVSPSLKAKAINQTAVECSWTGPRNVVRHQPLPQSL